MQFCTSFSPPHATCTTYGTQAFYDWAYCFVWNNYGRTSSNDYAEQLVLEVTIGKVPLCQSVIPKPSHANLQNAAILQDGCSWCWWWPNSEFSRRSISALCIHQHFWFLQPVDSDGLQMQKSTENATACMSVAICCNTLLYSTSLTSCIMCFVLLLWPVAEDVQILKYWLGFVFSLRAALAALSKPFS